MAHKLLLKISLTLTFLCSTLLPYAALAVDALSCADLNDPQKTKDWFITILEEQLGGKSSDTFKDENTVIIDCLRVTTPPAADAKADESGNLPKSVSEYRDVSVCTEGTTCQRIQVIMAKSGPALLYGYISFVYRWAAATIGMVCVGMLVYYGVRIASAGDNAGVIDEAKQHIIQSLGGLILLFLSAVILYTINPNFFVL